SRSWTSKRIDGARPTRIAGCAARDDQQGAARTHGEVTKDEDTERRGFRVTDRRRFTAEGETTAAEAPIPSPPGEPSPVQSQAGGDETSVPEFPVTFSTFVLGLGTQTLLHLGEIVDPSVGPVERDLAAAKHVIDILGILQDKTRNNLDPGEAEILESMLYD